jgi:hypothetical protein
MCRSCSVTNFSAVLSRICGGRPEDAQRGHSVRQMTAFSTPTNRTDSPGPQAPQLSQRCPSGQRCVGS